MSVAFTVVFLVVRFRVVFFTGAVATVSLALSEVVVLSVAFAVVFLAVRFRVVFFGLSSEVTSVSVLFRVLVRLGVVAFFATPDAGVVALDSNDAVSVLSEPFFLVFLCRSSFRGSFGSRFCRYRWCLLFCCRTRSGSRGSRLIYFRSRCL